MAQKTCREERDRTAKIKQENVKAEQSKTMHEPTVPELA